MKDLRDTVLNASTAYGLGAAEARAHAVAAALELIRAKLSASDGTVAQLEWEMERLSKYADAIQAALEAG